MRDVNWFSLSFEFLIVVIGIVAGFQITEWGERQKLRDLASQNLSRAIAETQYNYELLGQITERLERELAVFDSVLDRLLECDTPLTQNEIENLFQVTDTVFLPPFQSSQVNGLTQIEYSPFYSSNFLEALPKYLGDYDRVVKGTKMNHDDFFDWQFALEMLKEVNISKVELGQGEPGEFILSANFDDLCENPESKKRVWRLNLLMLANKNFYEYFKSRVEEFLPILQAQLQLIL
jgi:hypothetical protein